MADYGLSAYDAGVLVAEKETADYYESAVSHGGGKRDAKAVANWIMGDLSAYANTLGPVGRADRNRRRIDRRRSSISSARA